MEKSNEVERVLRTRGLFREALIPMMYGFGDDKNPYKETVDIIEDLVIEFITDIGQRAMDVRNKDTIGLQEIMFVVRKNVNMTAKIIDLLEKDAERKNYILVGPVERIMETGVKRKKREGAEYVQRPAKKLKTNMVIKSTKNNLRPTKRRDVSTNGAGRKNKRLANGMRPEGTGLVKFNITDIVFDNGKQLCLQPTTSKNKTKVQKNILSKVVSQNNSNAKLLDLKDL